jgi:hypothetical protein
LNRPSEKALEEKKQRVLLREATLRAAKRDVEGGMGRNAAAKKHSISTTVLTRFLKKEDDNVVQTTYLSPSVPSNQT